MIGPVCWSLALPLLLGAGQDDLPAGWKLIERKDVGFSVKMPAMPTEKTQQVKTATGSLNVTLLIADGRKDSFFVVSYSDLPETEMKKRDIQKRLDQARDGAADSARGKLRSEKACPLGAHPGREIEIEKDGEVIAKMRIYLVKNRLYQVMVLGNAAASAEKDVGTFLDSFRLVK